MKKEDLTNQTFGYLTVISEDLSETNKRTKWLCKCKCGNTSIVSSCALKSGTTTSCGCRKLKNNGLTSRISKDRNRLYSIWRGMRRRCNDPKNKDYKRYGGRGIKVCEDWNDSFLLFHQWAIDNGYADNLSIDRIDSDGNYEPNNCRWATQIEQQRNRHNNLFLTHENQTKNMSEWCEILNFPTQLAKSRCANLRKKGITPTFDLIFQPKTVSS